MIKEAILILDKSKHLELINLLPSEGKICTQTTGGIIEPALLKERNYKHNLPVSELLPYFKIIGSQNILDVSLWVDLLLIEAILTREVNFN